VPLQAVGVFPSAAEAAGMYPQIGEAFHTLSPFEIMNLGSGPWMRAG